MSQQPKQEQEQQKKGVPINALTDSNDHFFLFMHYIDSKKKGPTKTITKPKIEKKVEEKRFTHKRCCKCKRIFLFDNHSDCFYRNYCNYTCYTEHV
jgi:hypothetical protein